MKNDVKKVAASYLRAYIVAVAALLSAGQDDIEKIALTALATAVIGPLIRALNPNDSAFGILATKAEKEVIKLAQADKKKKKK